MRSSVSPILLSPLPDPTLSRYQNQSGIKIQGRLKLAFFIMSPLAFAALYCSEDERAAKLNLEKVQ